MGWIDNVISKFKRDREDAQAPKVRIVEHRGMKGYFTEDIIEEMERNGIHDWEKAYRAAVDEVLDEEAEEDNYKEEK